MTPAKYRPAFLRAKHYFLAGVGAGCHSPVYNP